MKKITQLLFLMLKIGLFTFGGGYAMIALLENEFVSKRKWIDKEEFLDMTAIAESTPGPIAINCATYLGFKYSGIIGAITATIGVCIPSFAIIYLISLFLDAFLSIKLIESAFKGVQVCIIFLIGRAGIKMLKSIKKTPFNVLILLTVFTSMLVCFFLSSSPSTIVYIFVSGLLSVVIYFINHLRRGDK